MARRQTLVQLTDDLVLLLDAIAVKRGETRSALIRSVLEDFLKEEDEAEKDRRLIEGYTKFPPGTEDDPPGWGTLEDWAEEGLRSAILEEPWEPSDP